jgi:hypothetical protein
MPGKGAFILWCGSHAHGPAAHAPDPTGARHAVWLWRHRANLAPVISHDGSDTTPYRYRQEMPEMNQAIPPIFEIHLTYFGGPY